MTNPENESGQDIKGHPAWAEILDKLPEPFQELIKPTLKKWDDGVKEKIESVRAEYDPYKNLIENKVPFEQIEQALYLMNQFQEDPNDVVAQAIEQFGLDYVTKSALDELAKRNKDDDDDDDDDDEYFELADDPRFKALEETVNKLTTTLTKKEQEDLARQQQAEFENLMEQLHEKHGAFDDTYVTALLSAGIDGEQAVKQFFDTVNQAAAQIANSGNENQQEEPPVVMGGSGSSGSGVPQQTVGFGSMSNTDLNKTVAELLAKQQSS